jgi:hypothetical protein
LLGSGSPSVYLSIHKSSYFRYGPTRYGIGVAVQSNDRNLEGARDVHGSRYRARRSRCSHRSST